MDHKKTLKIIHELNERNWKDEFKKNSENIIFSYKADKHVKELRSQSAFIPDKGVNPPLVILVGGMHLSGKSTLA